MDDSLKIISHTRYYRQKKLCGEEDCKRCGDGDIDEPCIGMFSFIIALFISNYNNSPKVHELSI